MIYSHAADLRLAEKRIKDVQREHLLHSASLNLLSLPSELILKCFSFLQPFEFGNCAPCKSGRKITHIILFMYADTYLIELSKKHIQKKRRKSACFYISTIEDAQSRQPLYQEIFSQSITNNNNVHICSLYSRFILAIKLASEKDFYLPECLTYLRSHRLFNRILLNHTDFRTLYKKSLSPRLNTCQIESLACLKLRSDMSEIKSIFLGVVFDLLINWTKSNVNLEHSAGIEECAIFCFRSYERAEALIATRQFDIDQKNLSRIEFTLKKDPYSLKNFKKIACIINFYLHHNIKFN